MRRFWPFFALVASLALVVWGARAYVAAPAVHVDPNDPCAFIAPAEFSEVGLIPGEPKRDDSPAGNGCSWSPVLGHGGSVRMQFLSAETYGKRKALDERALTVVPDLGDEAFAIPGMSGEQLYVKKGQRAFRIDGDGRFDRMALRPLAKAIASRM